MKKITQRDISIFLLFLLLSGIFYLLSFPYKNHCIRTNSTEFELTANNIEKLNNKRLIIIKHGKELDSENSTKLLNTIDIIIKNGGNGRDVFEESKKFTDKFDYQNKSNLKKNLINENNSIIFLNDYEDLNNKLNKKLAKLFCEMEQIHFPKKQLLDTLYFFIFLFILKYFYSKTFRKVKK